MSKPEKKKNRPIHKISFESFIAWGCFCGARWLNEFLRGKSDADLVIEREEAWASHLREMERQGF